MRPEGPADGPDVVSGCLTPEYTEGPCHCAYCDPVSHGLSEGRVLISCKAKIGNEQVMVQEMMLEVVYNDPVARQAAETFLRRKLMDAILEKWTPVITVTGR